MARKKKKRRVKRQSMPESVQTEETVDGTEEDSEQWHHVVTMEDLGDLKRKLHITYDSTAVQMALDKSCELIGKRVQIKGFRRGKAPKPLVESYCREEIEKSASSMLTQEGFLHACYEQKIQPLGEPKTENAEFHIDGTFTCDVTLEVKPTIEASGYVGLQLTKPKVDREEIKDRLVKEAKAEHIKEVPLDEVRAGAVVSLDFMVMGTENVGNLGKPIISEGKDHFFMVNEGQEPPFGENLFGHTAGDKFQESFTLPEEMEKYGGQDATVDITINSIFERVEPTDEELAVSMEAPSLEELMEAFAQRAEHEATHREMQAMEEEVVTKLLELHSFDVPVGWVDDEEKYLVSQLGIRGEIDESIQKHIREMAERNVRRTFVLEAVYEAEPGLAVKQEEFDEWLEKEAANREVSPLVLRQELQQNNMLDGVLGLIKHRKVLNFILSQAQITVEGEETVQENAEEYEIPEDPLG